MNQHKYFIILVLLFGLSSCKNVKSEKSTDKTATPITTDLQVDHFNIWVANPTKAKEKLQAIGFNAVPDSLSQVHTGQGTAGRYFNFLNGYLELIFVYDQNELEENNELNKDLDFTERANFEKNGASPFSIALKIKEYEVEKIPFEKVKYHQEWMEENTNIYSAKISKIYLNEPSIFVVYPEIEADTFETIADLKNIPEEYALWRKFFKHPNGAQKVTKLVISATDVDLKSETIKAVNRIENTTIKNGKAHLMELYFDNNSQGKSFDLRPELPLIVYL